jgi:hypothetical protein
MNKEEELLIQRIRDHKEKFRTSLAASFSKEMEEKIKEGKLFFSGSWVPREKLSEIYDVVLRSGKKVFIEIHLLVIMVLALNFFLVMLFKIFILP